MATALPLAVLGLSALLLDHPMSPELLSPSWFVLGLAGAVTFVSLGTPGRAAPRFTGVFGAGAHAYLVVALGCWATLAIAQGSNGGIDSTISQLLAVWLVAPPLLVAAHAIAWMPARRRPARTLVIGTGRVEAQLRDLALRHPEARMSIIGRLDDVEDAAAAEVLGSVDDLERVVGELGVERVVVAFSARSDQQIVERLRGVAEMGVEVQAVPRFFELIGPMNHSNGLGCLALTPLSYRGMSPAERAAKRAMDVVAAVAGLALAAFPMAVIALLIKLDDGGPVFFQQERVGLGERTFRILKFRTMSTGTAAEVTAHAGELTENGVDAWAIADLVKVSAAARVTKIGGLLRATSLDELPQLWNVLRGDMSIVGPRPLPLYEAPGVVGWQRRRYTVRPGITGLWQVMGRSNTPWEERMMLDYLYAQRSTLAQDARILFRTVTTVLARSGAR